jgi:hypothetical protein
MQIQNHPTSDFARRNMTESTIPFRKDGFRLEEMDNELLLFNPDNLEVLYLNPTARLVWEMCDGQRTLQQITDLLCEAYPEAAQAIPNDVQETLRRFLQHGAIVMP